MDLFFRLYSPIQHRISLQYFRTLPQCGDYNDPPAEKWSLLVSTESKKLELEKLTERK